LLISCVEKKTTENINAGPSKKYSASHLAFLERSFFGCSKKAEFKLF
jgi:hypothetical protein